jgi:BTB/POZ domain
VLEREHSSSEAQVKSSLSLPEPLNLPDANLVIRSSDLVNFRVHKSILAVVSPFFTDLLSLPQPSDAESIEGLPVVQLAEDAEVLNSLVSMLYPVPPVIPNSYEKVFHLLAACQKYDMVQVQSSIRAEVDRGNFPAPVETEAFRAYAIASSKRLVPEMDKAARLTLDHPMTFETIGAGLRLFQGSALRDLARFRKRCSPFTSLFSSLRHLFPQSRSRHPRTLEHLGRLS